MASLSRLSCCCPSGSSQERAALLETTLFVRCAAATLRGSCTGVLEVDVGGGVGFEVDQGVGALRLCAGETKNSPEGACVSAQASARWHGCTCDR